MRVGTSFFRRLLLGLVAAGLVVGLQDVIRAVAGWFNIEQGDVHRPGVELQCIVRVHLGRGDDPGRLSEDWHGAERIMTEEAVRVSSSREAEHAIAEMIDRDPVARTEVEPQVFLNATDNHLEWLPVSSSRSAEPGG